jgi:hypothetical protein
MVVVRVKGRDAAMGSSWSAHPCLLEELIKMTGAQPTTMLRTGRDLATEAELIIDGTVTLQDLGDSLVRLGIG